MTAPLGMSLEFTTEAMALLLNSAFINNNCNVFDVTSAGEKVIDVSDGTISVHNLLTPVQDTDAVNKQYVDDQIESNNKSYVDTKISTLNNRVSALISTAITRSFAETSVRTDLSTTGYLDPNTIYMIPSGDSENNVYLEYMYVPRWGDYDYSETLNPGVGNTSCSDWMSLFGISHSSGYLFDFVDNTHSSNVDGTISYTFNFTSVEAPNITFSFTGTGTIYYNLVTALSTNWNTATNSANPTRIKITNIGYNPDNSTAPEIISFDCSVLWYGQYPELIGSSKCDLSDYVTKDQYNELKATVDSLVAQTTLQSLA